jgi:RecB family exonuclease
MAARVSLVIGPPGAGIGDRVLAREVCPRLSSERFASFWFVTRTAPRRRQAGLAIAAAGNGALPGRFFTIPELVRACARRLADPTPVLGVAERQVLVAACAGARAQPGLHAVLARSLAELEAAGISDPDALPPGLLRDVARRYRQRLFALGMRDPNALFGACAAALQSGAIDPPELCILEGLYRPSAGEQALVRALAARAGRLILCAELVGSGEQLAPADALYAPLCALARALDAEIIPWREAPAPRQRVASRLFARASAPARVDLAAAVEVVAYPDARAEVDGIATQIRSAAQAGAALGEMVVAFPLIDDYAPLIREQFPRFGVPFDLLRGFALRTAPVVRAAFALADAALLGLARPAVERALCDPHVRLRGWRHFRIDRQARAAGIAGGGGAAAIADEWIEPLGRFACVPDDFGDAEARAKEQRRRDARFLSRALPRLGRLLAALGSLNRPRAPSGFAARLLALWRRLGLADPDPTLAPELVRRQVEAFARLEGLLAEVATGLELAGAAETTLADFIAALRAAVREDTFFVAPATRADRVQVMRLLDVRGLTCQRLWLGGLHESALPGPAQPQVVLAEPDRARLGLPTHEDVLAECRHLFALALAAPHERVTLSFPTREQPREEAMSSFVAELWRHAELKLSAPPAPLAPATAYPEERRQRLLARWLAPGLAEATMAGADAITQAIECARSRARSALGPWDGLLLHDSISAELRSALAEDLSRRAFAERASATQLDSYASCPFRHFAARMCGLSPLADPQEPDGTLLGRLVHAILCRFYRGLADAGAEGVRLRRGPAAFSGSLPAWIAAARPHLRAAAERELDRLRPPRADRFYAELAATLVAGLDDTSAGAPGLLRAFLATEATLLDEHEPQAFEQRFGELGRPGLSDEVALPEVVIPVPGQSPVRIVGSIDRVDRVRARPAAAVVIDYKTGKATQPRAAEVARGIRFQLPVYLAAIAGSCEPAGAGYYALADAGEVRRALLIAPEGLDPGAVLPWLSRAVAALALAARGGRFHPGHLAPREKGCSYCDFTSVCRVSHDRMHALALTRADGLYQPLPLEDAHADP